MKTKYRPALTLEQLKLIASKLDSSGSIEESSLLVYLNQFIFRADSKYTTGSYTTTKQSLGESLGFSDALLNAESKREKAAIKLESLGIDSLSKEESEYAYNWYLSIGSFPAQEIESKLESIVFA